MGAFDDLIPGSGQQGGSFDDLVPQQGPRLDAIEPPSAIDRMLARIPSSGAADYVVNRLRGFAMGAADPSVGAFQAAANVVGMAAPEYAQAVNKAIAEKEKQYEAERASVGSEGVDLMRLGGNVAAPTNLLLARAVPFAGAEPIKTLAAKGAGIGAAGGAMQPVTDDSQPFWDEKAQQVASGAAVGAVATPILGKLGEAIIRRIGAPDSEIAGAMASKQADDVINKALEDIGQSREFIPEPEMKMLRQQVTAALKQGKKLDAAALLRKQDFEAVGAKGTLGQITRDPMQFARERNLRGVEGVGEPLATRFAEQDKLLQSVVGDYAQGAQEPYQAGAKILDSLKKTDEALAQRVSALYTKARQSAGKDLDVPLQNLSQDYSRILGDFGDRIPAAVRSQFESLGLLSGKQTRTFNIEDANRLLQTINKNWSNEPATNRALSELNQAVKAAVTAADDTGGPFAPAVKAAASRFKLQDAVPALKAAAQGDIAADDVVRRFVIGGKTDDVKGLAKVLKTMDQETFNQARSQIGDYLQKAAFGTNAAGDTAFAQARYNKALRDLGTDKLLAFFEPNEVFQMYRLGRVGAYIHSQPSGAAVNNSNTAGAMLNFLAKVPGLNRGVALADAARNTVNRSGVVNAGVAGEVPVTAADLTPAQINRLRNLLGYGAAVGGGLAGASAR